MTFTLTRWSLNDLFLGVKSPELESAFNELETKAADFEKVRAELKSNISVERFLAIVRQYEEIASLENRLSGYAELSFNADTQDQAIQTLLGRVKQFLAEIENRLLFFNLWWKELDDKNAQRLMAEAGDYRYFLEAIRHFKPHTLRESEEKIINLKNVTGSSALIMLYDSITNRYTFKLEVDGVTRELTRGELAIYVRHTDPEVRARAYQELYRVYTGDGVILSQIYQALVRDWRNENVTLRSFATPLAVRNLSNDVPDEAVETLLDVCRKNAAIFQRYFRLKARHVNMPRLRRYDIYAPVSQSEKTYEYDAAVTLVLDVFGGFDPQVAALARQVFTKNHIDSEVRKGKQSGAFCATILPTLTPWVKVNYQGRADDVATLAHEIGHAIHSMLASHHSLFTCSASLPMAEMASTFGEMLLVDRMLVEETDEVVRRDLLFHQMDEAYATIMRQAYFAIFERQAHEMVQQNATVEELCAAYLENLKDQFGDSVDLNEEFRWEWISIPHIYLTPFYVYAYSFGQLLVLSLYQRFKAEGEAFKPLYIQLLAAGGSEAPERMLNQAGINIRDAGFWQGGFDVLAAMVQQLEKS